MYPEGSVMEGSLVATVYDPQNNHFDSFWAFPDFRTTVSYPAATGFRSCEFACPAEGPLREIFLLAPMIRKSLGGLAKIVKFATTRHGEI
jgi:hypothetical protein